MDIDYVVTLTYTRDPGDDEPLPTEDDVSRAVRDMLRRLGISGVSVDVERQ